MWETCDLNLCSEKCKNEILNTKKLVEEEKECKNLLTGYDEEKNKSITMEDDIKDIILERLRYCKRMADYKDKLGYSGTEELTYKDTNDLKNNLIKKFIN